MASEDALNWSSVIWTSFVRRIIFVSDRVGQKRIFEPSSFVAGSVGKIGEAPYVWPNAMGDRHSLPCKQSLLLEHTDFAPVTQVLARCCSVAVESAQYPVPAPQSASTEQPHVPVGRVTTMLFSTCRWSPQVMISPSLRRPRCPLLSQVLLRTFTLSDWKTAIQVPPLR